MTYSTSPRSVPAGSRSSERTEIDAHALVAEALDIHEPMARERSIAMVRELDVTGTLVRVDRNRMLQVFSNLLGNALKFCTPGDTIRVLVSRAEGGTYVIADNGAGIPETDLPHMFVPCWSGRGKRRGTDSGSSSRRRSSKRMAASFAWTRHRATVRRSTSPCRRSRRNAEMTTVALSASDKVGLRGELIGRGANRGQTAD